MESFCGVHYKAVPKYWIMKHFQLHLVSAIIKKKGALMAAFGVVYITRAPGMQHHR